MAKKYMELVERCHAEESIRKFSERVFGKGRKSRVDPYVTRARRLASLGRLQDERQWMRDSHGYMVKLRKSDPEARWDASINEQIAMCQKMDKRIKSLWARHHAMKCTEVLPPKMLPSVVEQSYSDSSEYSSEDIEVDETEYYRFM